MKTGRKILIIPMVVIVAICLSAIIFSNTRQYDISQFVPPEICSGCHEYVFNQWYNSMHNLALVDPVYKKIAFFFLNGLADKDEIEEAESCPKCHTPIGYMTGLPGKTSEEKLILPNLVEKGIQCDFCHTATGASKMYNNGMLIDPGQGDKKPGVKRGPFKDSESEYHQTEYSQFHRESEICGTCHNVRHVVFNTPIESTYDEWKNGPYNSPDPEKKVTCQGCHMYQRPGVPGTGSTPRPKNPGKASDFGPDRDHISTHYFIGGNSLIPMLNNNMDKVKLVEERLKNAAVLKIDDSLIKEKKIIFEVHNTGAGHYIPTGLTNVREMWLEIVVKDDKGKTVFTTGIPDTNNYLPKNTFIFNTVFGDGKGKPVLNIARAREILSDRRIPPLQYLKETISIPKLKNSGIVSVTCRLLYRSVPQKILDDLMGKGRIKAPITEMARVEKEIPLN